MDITTYLNSMRDPAGLPFYPTIFQILLVLTFALHITMVNVIIGGIFVAIKELFKRTEYSLRLAKALGRVITVSLSIAIVLGVAPLLFVQVIYDPFWYTATTMSAFWALMFLVVITIAFYSSYGFYLGNKKANRENAKAHWAVVAAIFVIFTALFIHMLSVEQLNPMEWKSWIVGPDGKVSFAGGEFHNIQLGRLLHFIIPSFAVTGIFLMLYSIYFSKRDDFDKSYLEYVSKKGANLALWSSILGIASGFWWLGIIPKSFNFAQNPFFLTGAILGIMTTCYLGAAYLNPQKYAIRSAIFMFITIFLMSCAREALRMDYMKQVGYSIFNYPLNIDWPSTILFFATFIMGLYVLSFPIVAAFKAGQASKDEVVTINGNLAKSSVALMIAWFGIVVAIGIVVSLKNGTLF